ncbi:TPA: type II secretion system protein GspM [Raoultella planticola]
MNKLKNRWYQMSLRERWLITGGSVLLILCMGYYTLWQPWQQQAEKWRNTIAREKNTVEWMQRQVPRLQAQVDNPQLGQPLSLSATVASTSSAHGQTIIRLQPQGERLAITLVAGDFNRLMQWLTQLEQQYRVHIVALDVSAQENRPGGVNINSLVLEGKAGR